ncbi:hypothetical protein [Salipiger abyssi]|uniref:Uncharacterized protein n=1 Tax=Salipiger abyssi TaxID=1250539 RepID=A0A1P8UXI2_9RHOB|nr:hypothetical protein [Salipiger abyssi]APZ54100.1 hypothetical protein Ga0080574_TMP3766 [Salipiger abyssi]
MTEEYGGFLHVPEVDADEAKITTDKAARSLAEAGLPVDKASVYFRNLTRAGLVHPYSRQKTGKKAYYFKPDQIVIAAVLWRMAEAGIAGEELRKAASQAASRAMSTWRAEDLGMTQEDMQAGRFPLVPSSPALAALVAYIQGRRGFSFELMTQRNRKTGDLWHSARIGNANGGFTNFTLQKHDDWENRSVFALDLDNVLAHLTRPREVAN